MSCIRNTMWYLLIAKQKLLEKSTILLMDLVATQLNWCHLKVHLLVHTDSSFLLLMEWFKKNKLHCWKIWKANGTNHKRSTRKSLCHWRQRSWASKRNLLDTFRGSWRDKKSKISLSFKTWLRGASSLSLLLRGFRLQESSRLINASVL